MTWQQDIARKAREAEQAVGISNLPNDPAAELNEMIEAVQGPPVPAAALQGVAPPLSETLGLDELVKERAERVGQRPAPARAPRKKGSTMKSRKKTDAPKKEAKAEAPEPQPEAAPAPMPLPTPPAAEPTVEDPMDYIASLPGGPSKEELQRLKQMFGEIYFLPLEGSTVFVFRYLNNFEWEREIGTQPQLMQNQEALKTAVLSRCVLWPKLTPEFMNSKQAGLPGLLFDVIMKASYFIEPADALMMVQKL
jgi:hypothetical protein